MADQVDNSLEIRVADILNFDQQLTNERNTKVAAQLQSVFHKFHLDQNIFRSVLWQQYTPHFPTETGSTNFLIGEREYSTYEDARRPFNGEGYTIKYIDNSSREFRRTFGEERFEKAYAAIMELEKVFEISPEVFKCMFEDHCCVSASRKTFHVSEYRHK